MKLTWKVTAIVDDGGTPKVTLTPRYPVDGLPTLTVCIHPPETVPQLGAFYSVALTLKADA